ncbi:NAD(P)/FAD-dependent oxidoreductase [Nocardioides sambongensis]|uniref:NAD(P)/FAD-dependent oxidoreductase n=1 Tax=Nocardioides sambongensis TaxID=2589074 RepID=UPI0011294810|nr:FAD-dependent oxidoreductase [Nocardioides sambongensis]
MSAGDGVLIVGGGQAASQLAVSLRERGYDQPIRIVGEERNGPYQRPPLSKAFLAGKADAETLEFRSVDFYAREHIEVVTGERIVDVELGDDGGAVRSASGSSFSFDQLVLAVGAEPRRLEVPGHDLDGVVYLRDVDDAEDLKARMGTCRDVVVVGGGFIGLEAAAVARTRGHRVTVLEAGSRLLARAVAPEMSEFYRAAHERRGTRVVLGASVERFVGDERVRHVELSDGELVDADLVIVGIGVVPRTAIAEQIGLMCDGGILVDAYGRTSNPRVLAAGDCTVSVHPRGNGSAIRLESVQHAVDQAKCVAATLVDQLEPYESVPWFWSDQDTLKLQIAGLSTGYDQVVVRGSVQDEKFALFYYRDGVLIAADAVNSPRDFMAVRRALGEGRSIPAAVAADPDQSLRAATTSPADLTTGASA